MKAKYKRILLKLSGEALAGDQSWGICVKTLQIIAGEIKAVSELNVDIGIVIGGGNFFRGQELSDEGMDRTSADYMGMIATVMNCLALQDVLENKFDVPTRVLTAITMKEIAEPYIRRRVMRHFEQQRVVIFGAGTGNPYFSTDTAASLRALETDSDIIFKATKVDGIYSADPLKDPTAKLFKELTFMEVLNKGLKVMDTTSLSLCMDNNLPIQVFNLLQEGNIKRAVLGESIGTIVRSQVNEPIT